MPSSRAVTRVAYGSAKADMNSHRPTAANPSISSLASAWNDGTIDAIKRDEKRGSSGAAAGRGRRLRD